ncbi:MAG: hypothetical protein HY778_00315 [Betaproteobacteria bacterium]|nr:hypothetical protein [Betaproteobacteria bacterium]
MGGHHLAQVGAALHHVVPGQGHVSGLRRETLQQDVGDQPAGLAGQVAYTGITNLDLRLRFMWLTGGAGTEFGEKQNSRRLELMARVYF